MYQAINPMSLPQDRCHGDEGLRDVTPEKIQAEAIQRKEKMLERQTPEDAEAIIEDTLVSDLITELVWALATSKPGPWTDSNTKVLAGLRAVVRDRVDELCGVE